MNYDYWGGFVTGFACTLAVECVTAIVLILRSGRKYKDGHARYRDQDDEDLPE